MRHSSRIKPISDLKANAADVSIHLTQEREPLIITENGEAKAILQDVASFEQTQQTLALLKITTTSPASMAWPGPTACWTAC
ncbi:type II toxin-antitoxin system Phd/YefM family antitoxin [Variovorax sp. PBL-H6]|uniref:type II toxin-antitoxin system Phd/YefM family antitoxin n=1 Tax=Variovorax sp. PBL-H6 TaxID=434009 RepID=UPI0013A55077|nr:type II toxin-antitoxin system Phd/YefM family antitoxin [Variovorax sp. PBL-H6]